MAEDYFDKANRREVYLHRFATHLVNQYTTPNLQAAYKSARMILLDAENITSNTQLNKINNAIITIRIIANKENAPKIITPAL